LQTILWKCHKKDDRMKQKTKENKGTNTAGLSLVLALVSAFFALPMMNAKVAGEDKASLDKVVGDINNGHPAQALKLSAALAAKNPRRPEVLTAHGLALLDCGEPFRADTLCAVAVEGRRPASRRWVGPICEW
jgi:hypothetical protein